MINKRASQDRGHFDHGWLDTYHTFSFGDYHDPQHMGFQDLRVINDDKIAAGRGFGTHPHRDMEIISYVVTGALAHKDSMGNGSEIPAGDFQYMSAGSGVTHSEFNPSADQATHLLQIWILPNVRGARPRYQQIHVPQADKLGKLKLVVSNDQGEGPIKIRQDVRLYNAILDNKQTIDFTLSTNRHAWVQMISGAITLNETSLKAGDGAAVSNESKLTLRGQQELSEILLFDLV